MYGGYVMRDVMKISQLMLVMVMAIGVAALAGCETNPYTGRS